MNLWYAYKGGKYTKDTPPFYDLTKVAWYDKMVNDLPVIRQDLLTFLQTNKPDMQEYYPPGKGLVEGSKWEGISFMFWKVRNEKLISKAQSLFDRFNSIPGMVALSISILQPKTHIKGHYGDTDAIYRVHIPISIPTGLPGCGLKVGGIARPWVEDDLIVFCDAHFHEAWNMSEEPRIVIIMDVIREEFLSQTDEICANVLSSFAYRHVAAKYKFIKKFPGWAKDLLRRSLKLLPSKQLS